MKWAVHPLGPPDCHYVNAVSGWLDLGNPQEALAELRRVSPGVAESPAVLDLAWRVHAALRDWPSALAVSQRMVRLAPSQPAGWVNHSYALHELRRTQEAWEHLLPAADQFPEVPTVPYNLACYACQLGDRAAARVWLERAAKILGPGQLKKMALSDPDLLPLRGWIDAL